MDTLDSSAAPLSKKEEETLTELQKQARLYRSQGLDYQNLGNLDAAKGYYQKAIQLDPVFAASYNDLGVVFEAEGLIDRAEECYIQAVKVDPNYLSAYSNLALLYENERDLDKAAYYWNKRSELGPPNDPWTQRARQRLRDIRAVSAGGSPVQDKREQEIVNLVKDVSANKTNLSSDKRELVANYMRKAKAMELKGDTAAALRLANAALRIDPTNENIQKYIDILLRKDNKALAASYISSARKMEVKGDTTSALKLAIDAQQLDPTNENIQKYVGKLQIRALSK